MNDIVVVAPPSPLSAWSFEFLEQALRSVYPSLTVLRLDRLDRIDDLDQSGGARLILSAFPPPALATFCIRRNLAPIILLDEILPSTAFVCAGGPVSALESVRAMSAGLTLAGACSRVPGAHLIRRGDGIHLLDMLVLAAGNAAPSRLRTACAPFGGPDKRLQDAVLEWEAGQNFPELTADEEQLAECVLGGLYKYVEDGAPGTLTWPGRAFLLGDSPGTTAPTILEVTGRARIIFYGPYFHLPRGRWKMRISFGFSHDIRGLPLNIQIASASLLGEVRILAERSGIFAVNCEVVVTDPHEPIEVRTMNEQGAIEGHVALASVEIAYLAEA